jgi:hypothetical protein
MMMLIDEEQGESKILLVETLISEHQNIVCGEHFALRSIISVPPGIHSAH